MSAPERVAAVIVTFNRSGLLPAMLDSLARQTRPLDAVIVINNASTDDTAEVLAARAAVGDLPLEVIHSPDNTGGAGGFHQGMKHAWEHGFDWLWIMDDDVVAADDCLATLLAAEAPLAIAVREDRHGQLVEKAALVFNLRNPLAIKPKTASIDSTYAARAEMPPLVTVENMAFEGALIHRSVIDRIGLPDPSYFIFYDDVDFALRARRAGFSVTAVRDAVLVRQLDFDQQHALDTWKGYYMYRNLFVVHFRFGENLAVRAKPYLIAPAVSVVSLLKRGPKAGAAETRNVWRALRDARGMRS